MKLIDNLTKSFNNISFKAKEHKPELLVASSIACAIGAVVSSIIATTKVDKVLKPANEKISEIKTNLKDQEKIDTGEVDPKIQKKKLAKIYASTGAKLLALYSPTLLLLAGSSASTIGVHNTMNGRIVALAGAYSTLDAGYKAYRGRVKEKFGEEVENAIYNDVRKEKKKVIEKDKDGNEIEKEEEIDIPHFDPNSNFVYCFDEANVNWQKNGRLNLQWLQTQEKYLNQMLQSKGVVFLDDVFKALDIKPTNIGNTNLYRMGRTFGWIYNPDDKSRDSYIDFGLNDPKTGNMTAEAMNVMRTGERNIWIRFNVDGDIVTKFDEEGKVRPTYDLYTR